MQRNSTIDNILERKEQQKIIAKKLEQDLIFSCKKVFATKEGQLIARYIKDLCGFADTCQDVNPNINIYQNARRDVYIKLRRFIPAEALIKIEIKE